MFKILSVSDHECNYLNQKLINSNIGRDFDVILSCGDLSQEYITFLADATNKLIYYINGNHDYYDKSKNIRDKEKYDFVKKSMPGAIDMHANLLEIDDYILCGFSGTMKYKKDNFQYTEKQMERMVGRVIRKIKFRRLLDRLSGRKSKRVIVFTHAPVKGYGDDIDECHQGFGAFLKMIKKVQPVLWIHGHVHLKDFTEVRTYQIEKTKVVNTFEFKKIVIDDDGTIDISYKL